VSIDESGALTFEQVDFAAVPASAESAVETVAVKIPAGSSISVFNAAASSRDEYARAAVIITVSEETELHATRRALSVSGPQSFAPPAGPSPSQIAAGKAAWLWRVGLFAGLILAGLGVWWRGGLVIAGGLSVAGASAFGWFVEENAWLLWLFGGGVALSALGFALWHLWLKKRQGRIEKNFLASASVATPS
jgi:hypothetical protein